MQEAPRFVSATSYSLERFAEIFTQSFEHYPYAGTVTAHDLAVRARSEQLDFYRSLVMLVDDEPVGQALLALRGTHAWCGGFGIAVPFRGKGLAHALAQALLQEARAAGARYFSLEVLTRNAPAIATYSKSGLQVRRDLLILEWTGDGAAPPADHQPLPVLVPFDPAEVAAHFAALHPVAPAWQRHLPALLVQPALQGIAIHEGTTIVAYVLYRTNQENNIRIADLGARTLTQAEALLAALKARSNRILTINEPSDSPLIEAYLRAGFVETERQHEMHTEL